MINHEWIKAEAEQLGCPVTDLLALARQNDPFYVGTPSSRAQGQWFAEVWHRGGFSGGVHLRRLHYWCVSQGDLKLENGKPYENTDRCWQFLCLASKAARYLGLVAIADIADHKSPEPHVIAQYQSEPNARFELDTPELSEPRIWLNSGDGFNLTMVQPYHLEIWVEKSTMTDVLLPVCGRFHANLVTGEGEMTLTAVHSLLVRLRRANKPARIFYISDFDPAGYSMPCAVSRKIEYLLQLESSDLDVKLRRLLLNRDHVESYQLPRTPIKETEKRAASFEARHGEGAVELDALEALHPGVLSWIVTNALSYFYDEEADIQARVKERQLRQAIRSHAAEITSRYAQEIKAIREMNNEMADLEIPDLDEYEPMRAEPDADDDAFEWLFDSNRGYLEQVAVYKEYSRGRALPDSERAA